MHILITRPEPDAGVWRREFEARGVVASVDPMLRIELLAPFALELDGVQALIATSRNGLRGLAGSAQLTRAVALPLYVVGPGTSELAGEMGFGAIYTGPAAGRELAAVIATQAKPNAGALMHLTGDKLAFDLGAELGKQGFEVRRLIVYRSRPADMLQPQTVAALRSGAIDTIMLMSPLSAKTFLRLGGDADLLKQYQQLVYVCLSANIARTLSVLGSPHIHVADAPNSNALFTLIERLAAAPS